MERAGSMGYPSAMTSIQQKRGSFEKMKVVVTNCTMEYRLTNSANLQSTSIGTFTIFQRKGQIVRNLNTILYVQTRSINSPKRKGNA